MKRQSLPRPASQRCLLASSDLEWWVREWRVTINVSKSNAMLFAKAWWRIPKPRPVQLLGEPIEWVDTARYLRVILDTRMTWSPRIVQIRKKATQILGLLICPSGTEFCCISSSYGPTLRYACPIWKSASCSHARKLQVLQSKGLHIATVAHWYISNVQITRI